MEMPADATLERAAAITAERDRCASPAEIPHLRKAAAIVNDLAAMPAPVTGEGECALCRGESHHDPRCPWLRAYEWPHPAREA